MATPPFGTRRCTTCPGGDCRSSTSSPGRGAAPRPVARPRFGSRCILMRRSDPTPAEKTDDGGSIATAAETLAPLPKRFGRGVALAVVAAILLVGLGASAILYQQANRIAE